MTLILTELSDAGIAMVADSAISMIDPITKVPKQSDKRWTKLIPVQKIQAAIAYWGEIGRIESIQRFDQWLLDWIHTASYSDLPSFADALGVHLNRACAGKTLREGQTAGIHVAGIHQWSDGTPRPTFYHVHNGHATVEISVNTGSSVVMISAGTTVYKIPSGDSTGSNVGQLLQAAQQPGAKLDYNRRDEPRTLFQPHRDFPNANWSIEENIQRLSTGYLTRNGDYAPFVLIAGAMDMARIGLNSIPDVSIPRRPDQIGARIG